MPANYTFNGVTLAKKIPTLNVGNNGVVTAANSGFFLYNSVTPDPITLTIDVTNYEPGHHWEAELITTYAGPMPPFAFESFIVGPAGTRVRFIGMTTDPAGNTFPFEINLVMTGVPMSLGALPFHGVYSRFRVVEPVNPATTDVELRVRSELAA